MTGPVQQTVPIPDPFDLDDAPYGRRVRLLSYNIQVGIASTRFRDYLTESWKHVLPHSRLYDNLSRIARAISDFDIVALQEVDAGSLRSGFVNQTEFLAKKAGFPFWHHHTNRRLGKIARHSNGLLSRFKPMEITNHKLPGRLPGRGVMVVRYGHRDNPLVLLVLHMALGARARQRQFEFVAGLVNRYQHVVVMGDLNCQPDSNEMRFLLSATDLCEPLHGLKTYPSWRPMRTLDHILTSPSLKVHDVHVMQHLLSDHLPIATEIILPDGLQLI
ncbi:Endonuclease/exonuclease/phosphatase family protein [hydrothermal vent metagenome]|uniref:Endonuclease/exonuclease/phosphatase family protein n=1 Tax=hydrothermal vent metagenome TaxID=652676 RepID=A0A3B1ADL5_9ZZZZ